MAYRDANPNSSPDRPFLGQSRVTPEIGPVRGEVAGQRSVEGPVTDQGSAGPGYYQTRGQGIKSGRTSPQPRLRASSRDLTLAKHGLIDQGHADPNQGQLFDANETLGPRRTDKQIIKEDGINMATHMVVEQSMPKKNGVAAEGPPKTNSQQFGATPGYMPNLDTKQKVKALESAQGARIESGTYRGGGATAEMMEDRTSARSGVGSQPWYSGVDSSGDHSTDIPGEAHIQSEKRASVAGVSTGSMIRAAALTSPQAAWDKGVPGGAEHRFPNLDHAAAVVSATETARPYVDQAEAMSIGGAVDVSDGGLGTMGAKAAGAQFHHGNDATDPTRIKSNKSQKAPNFRASLHLSDPQPAAKRMAAQSFTVDRHDVRAAGIDSGAIENKTGVYDVAAMTGARVAHKNRTLAPNEQAREWVGQRGPNQHESDHNGMIQHGTTGGKVVTNPINHADGVEATGAGVGNTSRTSKRQTAAYEGDKDLFG